MLRCPPATRAGASRVLRLMRACRGATLDQLESQPKVRRSPPLERLPYTSDNPPVHCRMPQNAEGPEAVFWARLISPKEIGDGDRPVAPFRQVAYHLSPFNVLRRYASERTSAHEGDDGLAQWRHPACPPGGLWHRLNAAPPFRARAWHGFLTPGRLPPFIPWSRAAYLSSCPQLIPATPAVFLTGPRSAATSAAAGLPTCTTWRTATRATFTTTGATLLPA